MDLLSTMWGLTKWERQIEHQIKLHLEELEI